MVEYHSMHEGRGYSYGRPLFRPQVLITQSELFALGGLFSDLVLPPTSVKGAAQAAAIKVASFLAGTVYDAISSGDYSPASPVNVAIQSENYIRPGNMPGINMIYKPSRVGSSLTSKSKTRGKHSKHSYVPSVTKYLAYYEGGKGKHEDSICRKGYRYVAKSGTLGMCVRN
jgi:hypothetical protein